MPRQIQKRSTIANYINRAYKYFQKCEPFHNKIQRVKLVLINNNHSNYKNVKFKNRRILIQ